MPTPQCPSCGSRRARLPMLAVVPVSGVWISKILSWGSVPIKVAALRITVGVAAGREGPGRGGRRGRPQGPAGLTPSLSQGPRMAATLGHRPLPHKAHSNWRCSGGSRQRRWLACTTCSPPGLVAQTDTPAASVSMQDSPTPEQHEPWVPEAPVHTSFLFPHLHRVGGWVGGAVGGLLRRMDPCHQGCSRASLVAHGAFK